MTDSVALGRPLRILHCIPTLDGGGAEEQLRLLAPCLVRHGFEVGIFSRLNAEDHRTLDAAGVRCFPVGSRGNHDPRLLLDLLRAIRAVQADVVQSWLPQMDILCGLARCLTDTKWILSERSTQKAYGRKLKERVRAALGNHADLIAANSESGLEVWSSASRRVVVPNGIDLRAIEQRLAEPAASPLPLREGIRVISVARLAPEKNLEVLIRAVAIARSGTADIRLVLLGTGPDRPHLEDLAGSLGLDGHVWFQGYQADPVDWMRAADMFVSASSFEGHPNAVLEAAACNIPTILSDIPEHRATLGPHALYAPMRDAAAFAHHIVRLAASPELRAAVATGARAHIAAFDAEAMIERYADEYRRLAGSSG